MRLKHSCLGAGLILLLSCVAPITQADVRVLWDVSQSMAQNDPDNFREEALLLMLDALPDGERAAVWTFGQYVNLLVPHEEVTDAWKADARAQIQAQGAPAVRTNMGRALEESSYDFDFSTYSGPTHIVLITDGQVDIAPNAEVNQVERERILSQLVPRYIAANARIHTVALSEAADHALLRQLSEQTGGQYQRTDNAENLTSLLAELTGEVAPMSELAMTDQSFDVDDSIREVTVLVYHDEGAVRLQAPDGAVNSALSPGNQQWRVGRGFSQVTVEQPETGTWQVLGEGIQPSSIRILSDINIRWLMPEGSALARGRSVELSATLVDADGEPLSTDLSDVIDAQFSVNGSSIDTVVEKDKVRARMTPAADARFANISLMMNGGTFSRLMDRQVQFVAPYISEVLMTEQGYEWRLYPNRNLANDIELMVDAEFQLDGMAQSETFKLTDAGYWVWVLPYDNPPGEYDVQLSGVFSGAMGPSEALDAETIVLTLPPKAQAGMAMTPTVADEVAMDTPDTQANTAFEKDPMPVFAELQADIIVDQPGQEWSEEPVGTEDSEGFENLTTYLLLSLPGILVLAGGYLVYRRLENKAAGSGTDDVDTILGGDEFSALDDIDNLPPDDELDIAAIEAFSADEPDAVSDSEPMPEPPIVDDDDLLDLPTPKQTEAPSPAVEDMLDETSESPEEILTEEEVAETDPEEELFDISSIDDDLADLDLALDGDDPFADDEDPDNRN